MRLSEFLNEAAPVAPAQPAAAPAVPANPTMTSRTIGTPELSADPIQNFKNGVTDAKEFYDLARKAGMSISDAIPLAYAKGQATATGDIGSFVTAVSDKATGTAEKGLAQLQSTVKDYADLYAQFQPTSEYYKKNIAPNPQLKAQADEFIRTNLTPQQYAQSIQQAQAQLKAPRATPTQASATVPSNPASQPPVTPTNETVELNRILKLSGMEFIAEDATGTQQFVGTGSSSDWTMSDMKATADATRQMIKQKYGNNPPPGNGIELRYYNKQQQTVADPAKPGNYLTTVTFTPIELKLSPAMSAKPSMDPTQDFDYFYKGQQVKPGDAFYDRIKQIHLSLGAAPAEPATTTNETAELSRLSKLISEDSSKSITVQRGDTLGKIAADNSTTVDALVKLNNISNPDRIYPGDVIKLPGGQGDPGGRKKRQGNTQNPDRPAKQTTTTSTGNPKIAMEFFIDQGWTPEQAAGLVANLQAESYERIDPAADYAGAYGIAQWRGSRKRDFEQEMGIPLRGSSLEDQLKFVQHELNNKESKAGNLLKQATTAAEAAAIVDQFYERSGNATRQQRIAAAKSLLTAFA